jgi:hypothetical protein
MNKMNALVRPKDERPAAAAEQECIFARGVFCTYHPSMRLIRKSPPHLRHVGYFSKPLFFVLDLPNHSRRRSGPIFF